MQINGRLDEADIQTQRLESHRRDLIEQAQTANQYMASAFEEIRQRLDAKEREMQQKTDDQLGIHLNKIDNLMRLVDGRKENLSNSHQIVMNNYEEGQ